MVAFLKVGKKAVVKLTSYDFKKYGGLDGELESLGPDTMKDERKQSKPSDTPGMTASVEIRTGQKTVVEYLFRPLQNVSQALRER